MKDRKKSEGSDALIRQELKKAIDRFDNLCGEFERSKHTKIRDLSRLKHLPRVYDTPEPIWQLCKLMEQVQRNPENCVTSRALADELEIALGNFRKMSSFGRMLNSLRNKTVSSRKKIAIRPYLDQAVNQIRADVTIKRKDAMGSAYQAYKDSCPVSEDTLKHPANAALRKEYSVAFGTFENMVRAELESFGISKGALLERKLEAFRKADVKIKRIERARKGGNVKVTTKILRPYWEDYRKKWTDEENILLGKFVREFNSWRQGNKPGPSPQKSSKKKQIARLSYYEKILFCRGDDCSDPTRRSLSDVIEDIYSKFLIEVERDVPIKKQTSLDAFKQGFISWHQEVHRMNPFDIRLGPVKTLDGGECIYVLDHPFSGCVGVLAKDYDQLASTVGDPTAVHEILIDWTVNSLLSLAIQTLRDDTTRFDDCEAQQVIVLTLSLLPSGHPPFNASDQD